jgi:hypothetical protein
MNGVWRQLALAAVAVGAGCAKERVRDPIADLRDPQLSEAKRREAIKESWKEASRGEVDRGLVREELKGIGWGGGWPTSLRVEALRLVLEDPDPAFQDDNRQFVRLRLPTAREPEVVTLLCRAAERGGWSDLTPALVRSLSRQWPNVRDVDRPEYATIAALNQGQRVERVIYDTFLFPPEDPSPTASAERTRADAWDLLGRLDLSGKQRADMLMDPQAPDSGPVADMRASLLELRCLPVTGEELRWLTSLRQFGDAEKLRWWKQASAAVGGLEQDKATRLSLRHAEPVRWASAHRSEWVQAPRQRLLEELRARLATRQVYKRDADPRERWKPAPERLADWESRLCWADLLTILVIDDGLHDGAVVRTLFAQASMDRDDKSAEYGGLFRAAADTAPAGSTPWAAVLYPPRPANRQGDKQFVASTDMVAQGDHALSHYHFHVQDPHNSAYAGPSSGDMAYAARMGRTCLVFTSLDRDTMDVDLYQPDGVVIDLGAIVAPPPPPAEAAGR